MALVLIGVIVFLSNQPKEVEELLKRPHKVTYSWIGDKANTAYIKEKRSVRNLHPVGTQYSESKKEWLSKATVITTETLAFSIQTTTASDLAGTCKILVDDVEVISKRVELKRICYVEYKVK